MNHLLPRPAHRLACLGVVATTTIAAHAASLALEGQDINDNPVGAAALDAVFEYDPHLNLTWLRDWNVNVNNGDSGLMTWDDDMSWATHLTVGSFSGWRLPTADTGPSSHCERHFDPGIGSPDQYYGYNCIGSELGYLYYLELGNTNTGLIHTGPFEDMQVGAYVTSTAYAPPPSGFVWDFQLETGKQEMDSRYLHYFAVAVRPGDVHAASVPERPSMAMALAALAVLSGVGVRRRRTPRVRT